MPPIGKKDGQSVALQIQSTGNWETIFSPESEEDKYIAKGIFKQVDSTSYYYANQLISKQIIKPLSGFYTKNSASFYSKNYNAGNDICPAGWHVPTDAEIMTMEEFLGMCSGTASGCSGDNPGCCVLYPL